jgi:hypothetical protein
MRLAIGRVYAVSPAEVPIAKRMMGLEPTTFCMAKASETGDEERGKRATSAAS